jgi:hypothetical protein
VGRTFRKFEAFVDLVLKKLLYIKHRLTPEAAKPLSERRQSLSRSIRSGVTSRVRIACHNGAATLPKEAAVEDEASTLTAH